MKLTYKDQRDYDGLPKRIEAIDVEIANAETEMANPKLYTSNFARFTELTAQTEALRTDKDAAEERWLQLAEMVEAFAS